MNNWTVATKNAAVKQSYTCETTQKMRLARERDGWQARVSLTSS